MQAGLLTTSEACDYIKKRLLSGWLIASGDHAGIRTLEECIYAPGTPANADFEIIGFPNTIYLARKTEGLRTLLKNPSDFDEIQIITFGQYPDGSPGVAIDSYDPDVLSQEEAAAQVVAKVKAYLVAGPVRGRAKA